MRPPDKFDMVDMEGIDLLAVQGEEIPGLYDKLVESITLCRYQCLYNWSFNGILIPPTYVEMEVEEDGVWINEGVMVDEEDVVHIASIEPEPPAPVEPVIESLSVTENGTYQVPQGVDGFNPVEVLVPSTSPVIQSITITENGTVTAPAGIDGYSPITVNVPTGASSLETASIYKWTFGGGQAGWGWMKTLLGSVIGQNVDNTNSSVSLVGSLMTVIFHGNSQSLEIVANTAITLREYRTSRTLGEATLTTYTMAANEQRSFSQQTVYGGIYFEAEAV